MSLVVNGEEVPAFRLASEIQRLQQQAGFPPDQMPPSMQQRLEEAAKEHVVGHVLLWQEARRRYGKKSSAPAKPTGKKKGKKPKPPAEPPTQADAAEQNQMMAKLMSKICEGIEFPAEPEGREFYDQNIDRFHIPEAIHASHIVKHAEEGKDEPPEAILQAKQELADGADFAEVAGKYSDCPSNGGDLGRFPKGQMVEAFDDVVFSLEPGEISDVFVTEFGHHIAVVHEAQPSRVMPFDDVKEDILRMLIQQREEEKIIAFLEKPRAAAKIEER